MSDTENLPYRLLACEIINTAFMNAMGLELTASVSNKYKCCKDDVRRDAIAYILSDDFVNLMELLGLDSKVDQVRDRVTNQTYQMPLNPTEINHKIIADEYWSAREKGDKLSFRKLGERYNLDKSTIRYIIKKSCREIEVKKSTKISSMVRCKFGQSAELIPLMTCKQS